MVCESTPGQQLSGPDDVYNVVKPLIAGHVDVEAFYCIFMNAKNKVLSIEKMFSGTITTSAVYPREIIKKVLEFKSSAVVLCHNHPSGDTEPSNSDYEITLKIGFALDSIGVCIHDHIVIGKGYHSMQQSGKLKIIQDKISDVSFN